MATSTVDRVLDLAAKIKDHRSQLAEMEAEFNGLIGGNNGTAKRVTTGATKKRGRPAKKGAPATKKRGRPKGAINKAKVGDDKKNAMPLTRLIPEILQVEEGNDAIWMSHPEIVAAILGRGYKTASKDFENVVYQTLRKKVRDEELVYDEEELKFALAEAV